MKVVGVLLIILSIFIGYISDSITNQIWFERAIGFSFGNFLFGIFILIKTSNCRFMRGVPNPPEHLRPKKKCICNDIGKHTPGGRCEAEHSVNPKKCVGITPHGRLYRPEFPKDRT